METGGRETDKGVIELKKSRAKRKILKKKTKQGQ